MKYRKSESLSTDSVYHYFSDDNGREVKIRVSDHDANFFREPADYDFPLKTPFEEIEKKAEELIERKNEKQRVFFGDIIDRKQIIGIEDSRLGRKVKLRNIDAVKFKDRFTNKNLDSFENKYDIKLWNRKRKEDELTDGRIVEVIPEKSWWMYESGGGTKRGKLPEEFIPSINENQYGSYVIDGETIRVTGNPKAQIKVYKEYTDAGYVLDLTKESNLNDGGIISNKKYYEIGGFVKCSHCGSSEK